MQKETSDSVSLLQLLMLLRSQIRFRQMGDKHMVLEKAQLNKLLPTMVNERGFKQFNPILPENVCKRLLHAFRLDALEW